MNQNEYDEAQTKTQKFDELKASLDSCECALKFLLGIDVFVKPKYDLCASWTGKERHRFALVDISTDPAKLLAALVPFIQERAASLRNEMAAL